MKKKYFLFKVKDGKLAQWVRWCNFLKQHEEVVRETLVEERVTREYGVLFSDGENHYVVGGAEFTEDPVPANLNVPLNAEHLQNRNECLMRISRGEELYDVQV